MFNAPAQDSGRVQRRTIIAVALIVVLVLVLTLAAMYQQSTRQTAETVDSILATMDAQLAEIE